MTSLLDLPRTAGETVDFLRHNGLLADSVKCCGRECRLEPDKCSDGEIWKCRDCNSRSSIRAKSFFSGSKLQLSVILHIIYLFSANVPIVSATKLLKNSASAKSIIQWYAYIREVCSFYLINNDEKFFFFFFF